MMSKNYLKVSLSMYVKDVLKYMKDNQQNCALVADDGDFLEGILTNRDIKRYFFKKYGDSLKGDPLSVCIDNVCCIYCSVIHFSLFCFLLRASWFKTCCISTKIR